MSKNTFDRLIEIIGPDAAQKLQHALGGRSVYVPASAGAWGCRCTPVMPRFRISGRFGRDVRFETAVTAVASMAGLSASVSGGRATVEVETCGLGDGCIDALRTALADAPVDVVRVHRIGDATEGA